MTSLNNIEEFLNIEIGNKRLRNGKKKMNKNTYYWFHNEYYIVNLSNDKWCIISTGEQTRELLNDHIWHCDGVYVKTSINQQKIRYHRMLMNPPNNMCIDHINRRTFDNRLNNLRIVTHKENMRNKSMSNNNTSSIVGVLKEKKNEIPIVGGHLLIIMTEIELKRPFRYKNLELNNLNKWQLIRESLGENSLGM